MPAHLLLRNQICLSIYSASNALVRTYRPLLESLDLTYPQYLVMLALWEKEQLIAKQIGQMTRFDAGTLSPILKRLESKGLITRIRSNEDERQRLIVLTDEGKALAEKASDIPQALSCQINMSVEEALQLKQLAEQLYAQLTDSVES